MKKLIKQAIIIFGLIILLLILSVGQNIIDKQLKERNHVQKMLFEKHHQDILNDAKNSYNALFENNIPKSNQNDLVVATTIEKINNITRENDIPEKETMLTQIEQLKIYMSIEREVTKYYKDNLLLSTTTAEDIENIKTTINTMPASWRPNFEKTIVNMQTQYDNIVSAKKKVTSLFTDSSLKKVKSNVTRKTHNNALIKLNNLPQKDIVDSLNPYLDKVLETIEKREEQARRIAEEKARREAAISNSWVILNTPYISQNQNEVFNGCEAASLLMALQYKGYLRSTSYHTFVENMPKSDNPHTGFYRDIYSRDPRDVPHWIAPEALAKYGRESSGNQNVIDITGSSVKTLQNELSKNNPVIVYATGGYFHDPINWVEEVPQNIHVLLLIGYNPVSKQLVLHDPWTRNSTGLVYIDEARFTTIYNQIGKKAVVIR